MFYFWSMVLLLNIYSVCLWGMNNQTATGTLVSVSLANVKQSIDSKYSVESQLSTAASKGNTALVTILLDAGANINSQDNSGRTPLYWAAVFNHIDTVKLLLSRKAHINHQDLSGWTILHGLAAEGNVNMYSFFMEEGANNCLIDKAGCTPSVIASRYLRVVKGEWHQDKEIDQVFTISKSFFTLKKMHVVVPALRSFFKLDRAPTFDQAWLLCKTNADKIKVFEDTIVQVKDNREALEKLRLLLEEESFLDYLKKDLIKKIDPLIFK